MSRNKRSKQESWPVVVVLGSEGLGVLRWYAGRNEALKVLRAHDPDEVMFIQVGAQRVEVSFHESLSEARKACDRDMARGLFASGKYEGSA